MYHSNQAPLPCEAHIQFNVNRVLILEQIRTRKARGLFYALERGLEVVKV